MNRNFEISLTILYVLNVGMSIYTENWVACMGWGCALLAQLRIMDIIRID
jgi:hypothetical protein